MSNLVIYQNDDGGVSIIIPSHEALMAYGIDAIAQKDVPEGKPYKIISSEDVPTDRSDRDAWTVDAADLTDGVGGPHDVFYHD